MKSKIMKMIKNYYVTCMILKISEKKHNIFSLVKNYIIDWQERGYYMSYEKIEGMSYN